MYENEYRCFDGILSVLISYLPVFLDKSNS